MSKFQIFVFIKVYIKNKFMDQIINNILLKKIDMYVKNINNMLSNGWFL